MSFKTAAAEAAEAAATQAQRSLEALTSALAAQKEELKAFVAQQVAAAEASLAATREMGEGASSVLDGVRDKAESTKWVAPLVATSVRVLACPGPVCPTFRQLLHCPSTRLSRCTTGKRLRTTRQATTRHSRHLPLSITARCRLTRTRFSQVSAPSCQSLSSPSKAPFKQPWTPLVHRFVMFVAPRMLSPAVPWCPVWLDLATLVCL